MFVLADKWLCNVASTGAHQTRDLRLSAIDCEAVPQVIQRRRIPHKQVGCRLPSGFERRHPRGAIQVDPDPRALCWIARVHPGLEGLAEVAVLELKQDGALFGARTVRVGVGGVDVDYPDARCSVAQIAWRTPVGSF